MSSDVVIRVGNLGKQYRIGARKERYRTLRDTLADSVKAPLRALRFPNRGASRRSDQEDEIWALKDVSFEVKRGEVVGVIGRNGAGKSTLLKILSRITEPTTGYAEIQGRVGSLLEVGTGFNPELTGRENIFLNGAILGMRRSEIDRKFDEIVAFSEVERFIDTPVKRYSSGMYLRLAFAVSAHLEPEILLVDEVLAVGDAEFQKKCLGKMEDVSKQGRTILFVSHNMGAVRSLCSTGLFLQSGHISIAGDLSSSIEMYYKSIGLLAGNKEGITPTESSEGFGLVKIENHTGNTVSQSEPFVASTSFTLSQETNGFSIFCILHDMNGRTIFHIWESSSNLKDNTLRIGSNDIKISLPALWLNPNLYSLQFKIILSGAYGSSRYTSDYFPLDIVGQSSVVEAVIHPVSDWSIV